MPARTAARSARGGLAREPGPGPPVVGHEGDLRPGAPFGVARRRHRRTRRSRRRRHAGADGTVPTSRPTPPARRARSSTTSRAWWRGLRRSLSAGLASSRTTARPSRSSGHSDTPAQPDDDPGPAGPGLEPAAVQPRCRGRRGGRRPGRRRRRRPRRRPATTGRGPRTSASRSPARQVCTSSPTRAARSSPGSGRHRNDAVPAATASRSSPAVVAVAGPGRVEHLGGRRRVGAGAAAARREPARPRRRARSTSMTRRGSAWRTHVGERRAGPVGEPAQRRRARPVAPRRGRRGCAAAAGAGAVRHVGAVGRPRRPGRGSRRPANTTSTR